jgi:hypothetical protein
MGNPPPPGIACEHLENICLRHALRFPHFVVSAIQRLVAVQMKTAIQTGTFTLLVLLCVVAGEAARLLIAARADLDRAAADIHALVLPTEKAEANLAALANTGAQVAQDEQRAFAAQQNYFSNLSARTGALLDSATATLQAVNRDVLPGVSDDLSRSGQLIGHLSLTVDGVADAAKETLTNVDRQMENPAIAETLRQIQLTSVQATATSAHFNSTAANLDAASLDFRNFVHRELSPARGVKNTIKAALDWAWRVRGATGL